MSRKVSEVDQEVRDIARILPTLADRIRKLEEAADTPRRPFWGWKYGTISLDFWPPSGWFRLNYEPWGTGGYAQLIVGPIRIDWLDG